MWWRKKQPETVICQKCCHSVIKRYCQEVKILYTDAFLYYCPMHKVKYNEQWTGTTHYGQRGEVYETCYFQTQRVRVNEDGTPYVAPKPEKGNKSK